MHEAMHSTTDKCMWSTTELTAQAGIWRKMHTVDWKIVYACTIVLSFHLAQEKNKWTKKMSVHVH